MTYAASVEAVGREPVQVVEIILDRCPLVHGVGACLSTSPVACYNTLRTCNSIADYEYSTHTYRFCEPRSNLPAEIQAHPVISGRITRAPMKITPGEGLGLRGSVKIKLRDFTTCNDDEQDPYGRDAAGTFFGRLKARNPYYIGRELKLLSGYVNTPFSWDDFQTRTYVIEDFSGPGADGFITITAKTVLKNLDDDRVKVPAASTGVLSAGINSTATSLTLSPAGAGDDYPTSGAVRSGSEIITYTGKSTDTLTGLTRGQWGSEADDHDADDSVQLCKIYSAENVVDIVYDLVVTEGGIPSTMIPSADWAAEEANWLTNFNLTTIISEPTGIKSMLTELCEQCGFDLWEDEINNEIKLKANVPDLANATLTSLTDDQNIISKSIKVSDNQKSRISRVLVYFDKIDFTGGDGADNFHRQHIAIDSNSETDDRYASERIKVIKSSWYSSANESVVSAVSARIINRFADPQPIIKFQIDAADEVEPGQLVDVTTRYFQDITGESAAKQFQVLQVDDSREPGHKITVEGLGSSYSGRYAYIALNSVDDYSTATDPEKLANAFISPDSGVFDDGQTAYKII